MSGFTINHVVISGNLTRDPELKALPSGTSVCEIGVAVNERVKDQTGNWTDRANFFDVTIWGGMGEWVGRTLKRGSGIAVSGRLRFESWEKDGQKRSKVKIVADSIMPRSDEQRDGPVQSSGNYGGYQQQPIPASDVASDPSDFHAPGPVPTPDTGYGQLGSTTVPDDDDIPF